MDKDEEIVPNMDGKNRPMMLSDKFGYPESVGDEDWETKHKKYWEKVPGGWRQK